MFRKEHTKQKRPPTPRYPKHSKHPKQCQTNHDNNHNNNHDNYEHPDDKIDAFQSICIQDTKQNTQIDRPKLVLPKQKHIRIAFCGKLCSGKTTLAKHVQSLCKAQHIDVKRIAFGDYVKSVATDYFHMKEKDRTLLTQIGTSMRSIDENVWVNCVKNCILQSKHQHWVVDDLRYKNEYDMLKELGFKIIRLDISREEQTSRIQNTYKENSQTHMDANQHSSEQQMVNQKRFYLDEVIPVHTTPDIKLFFQDWLSMNYTL